ncbi:hypothetical protein [Nocardia brasiliensis]|uniref:hypothetical protein n=1 Tax=Nocardia brasiliensis TaxID=37326 RepID=UPI0036718C45
MFVFLAIVGVVALAFIFSTLLGLLIVVAAVAAAISLLTGLEFGGLFVVLRLAALVWLVWSWYTEWY